MSKIFHIIPILNYFILMNTCCGSDPFPSTDYDTQYTQKLSKFLSTGLTQIIWENVSPKLPVGSSCGRSLQETISGLIDGSSWAYRLIDASSKSPSGFLDGTITSFGDYDECLRVENSLFTGKHCMIKLDPTGFGDNLEIQKYINRKNPVFDYYYINLGLCLPSTCSKEDISILVNQSLRSYPLRMLQEFECDTLSSNLLSTKVENATVGQIIAGVFLGTITMLCVMGTISELVGISSFLNHFSMINNSKQMVRRTESGVPRLDILDGLRLFIVVFGIIGHCFGCLETVPGWYIIHNLHVMKTKFELFIIQPMLNEGGMGLVTFVGGFGTFWSTHKLITAGTFQFKRQIFDRWIRYMPSLMCMVAIDILWPFSGDGPFFTQISKHLLQKCTNFAWMNFLFIGNMRSAPENCIPHTFYSSIDLQLFIIGLFATYLICNKPKVGVAFCSLLIILGNSLVIIMTHLNQASPVLIDYDVTVQKTINYLDHVHFATYGHLSNYFIGVLVAYSLTIEGFLRKYERTIRFFTIWALFSSSTIHFAPSIHNTFKILPSEWVPLYIPIVKLIYVSYGAIFLYLYHFDDFSGKRKAQQERQQTPMKPEDFKKKITREEFSFRSVYKIIEMKNRSIFQYISRLTLVVFLTKLSFGLYVINYTYIRYDFFTSRVQLELTPHTFHAIGKRITYTMGFVLIMSYLFQIMFVAPFDNIRRSIEKRDKRNKQP